MRSASVLAPVADSVNCQKGRAKRAASSSATAIASSPGSRKDGPSAMRFCTAAITGAGVKPQLIAKSTWFMSR